MEHVDAPLELIPAQLDTRQRFVRVTGSRGGQFVEFDFALGEPEIFVELILTPEAFADFCAVHQAQVLPPREADDAPQAPSDWDWRLTDATQTRFRQ
ncbi:phenol hydroxylase [Pseudomonas sp. S31]|uniref:phenol hydroxylase subunit n=1 Tax=Pseudomonas sp. S31 TaxID=1564473 RepID=UPI001911F1A8|nr:phenol hydroxylase subunit [Pseudomonas sp. S31]MBK5002408.1 phenol hydroxylase [Pseudomonas sp. S31]